MSTAPIAMTPAVAATTASISLATLHDGSQTAWDFPINFRVPMLERLRCVPHRKHDIVEVLKLMAPVKGEPLTFDW
jgi:hypothetical protein